MTEKHSPPHYNQYGLKDEDPQAVDVYGNRPGGEQAVIGPADTVDAAGHRVGAKEDPPFDKPSSRTGQAAIGEVDDKQR